MKDLTGQRFGRLTVYVRAPNLTGTHVRWGCLCDCGTTTTVTTQRLTSGKTKSCGCFRRDHLREIATTHNLSSTPEWWVLAGMRKRCYDTTTKGYQDYGGRGITICDRWLEDTTGVENFLADMGPRPSPQHTIERVDNNLGYTPENCVWLHKSLQSKNRRNTHWLTAFGRTQPLRDWAKELGINHASLVERLQKWPLERALSEKKK